MKCRLSLGRVARCATFAVVAMYVSGALAVNIEFPNTDGKGDLASTASWNQDPIPDSTNRPSFTQDGAGTVTLKATEDISFAGLLFKLKANAERVFDLTEASSGSANRTVTLSGGITTTTDYNRYTTRFKGGVWNVTGGLSAHSYGKTHVSNGAVMTFSGNIGPLGTASTASEWRFSGAETRVSAARAICHVSGGYCAGNVFEVSGGARLTLTGGNSNTPAILTGDQQGGSNGFTVTGIGSEINITASGAFAWIGSGKGGSHYLKVEDGASFNIGSGVLRIGNSTGNSSVGAYSRKHKVLVSTGASLSASGLQLGYAAYNMNTGLDTFSLTEGASATISGDVKVSPSDSYPSYTNMLIVASGATMNATGNLHFHSKGNIAAISNATMTVGGNVVATLSVSGGSLIYNHNKNNTVLIGGTNGTLSVTGDVTIALESTLRFGYPEDGYAAGIVPLTAKSLSVSADSSVVVDGLAERIANKAMKETENVVLASTTGGVTIPAATLEAANATLPEKCALSVSADGKKLLLRVYKRQGFVICVF